MNNSEIRKFPTIEKRLVAWLVDGLIIGLIIFLARITFLGICLQLQIRLAGGKVAMISLAIGVVIAVAYHTFFEASKLQATPGKLLFNVVVTDLSGGRISHLRALTRHICKYASALSFGLGYLLFFVSKKRQCLHDMLAQCLVAQKTTTS